ncbi:hypothetical protein B0H34DRAFT_792653 [Crassisporium funariophilum]|nr:hypothetical protein B0H34DRAFT_792653 [Crassisporium funariophilum]
MASAQSLLDDIQCESLQQLLVSVQRETKPPGFTCIPSLDSFLMSSKTHRAQSSRSSLDCGDTLLIQGQPSSGKTHLLYFLLATCTMPPEYLSRHLGGWNKAAFVYDMDGKFSISRWKAILVDRLTRLLPSASITPLVERCLKLLHIFRPKSTDQLIVSLAHLPKYHFAHFSGNEMGIVAIHSINAFHWLDRFKAEQLLSSNALSNKTTLRPDLAATLQAICVSHSPVTVVTDWGLAQYTKPSPISITNMPRGTYSQHPQDPQVLMTPNAQSDNMHPNAMGLPFTCQITLAIAQEDTLGKKDIQGFVNIPSRAGTGMFTLKIRDDTLLVT